MSYRRFAVMIAISTLVMFGLMYLNTYAADHIRFSQTRAWMALMMGGVMAALMIGFMWSMYDNKRLNTAILAGAWSPPPPPQTDRLTAIDTLAFPC